MTPLLSSTLLATQSDARLLALAADGHDRAFEAIVERYRRPLGRYLRRVLSGPLAEDVLQATFVNAWRSLQRGTDVRDLRPWLYRIAHNQAVNALARAEPSMAIEHDADRLAATAAGPEAEVEQRETLRSTLTAIAGLPDRQRAALVAVAVADRPHPDVARELGLSEGALRQLVHRARTTLRAAATAVVPLPLVTAALGGGGDSAIGRVAEVAAGAGGAGLGVKTGAALLAAGALVVGAPAVHEERAHQGLGPAVVRAGAAAPRPHRARTVTVRVAPHAAIPAVRHAQPRPITPSSGDVRRRSAPAPVTRHQSGESEHSGSGGSGNDDGRTEPVSAPAPSADDHNGTSHDGTTQAVTSEASGSRSSSHEGSGSPEEAVAPAQTATTEGSDSSGPGSGSSDDLPSLP